MTACERNEGPMQYKSVPFELKREPDEDGVIEGYASVFDVVDLGLDVVAPGAFRKTLGSGRKVRMLWQHDMGEPIGVWDEMEEDSRGLRVKGRISKEVQRGKEAMALFKMGAMDSLSIGYRTVAAENEGGGRVRRIMEAELWEVSVVTNPMLPDAQAMVKSIQTEREFERFLRDAGYSRKESAAIALHGFKGLEYQREAVVPEVERNGLKTIHDQLKQLQETLKDVR